MKKVTFLVLVFLLLFGGLAISKEDSPVDSMQGKAWNQYLCFFGSIYKKESDSCVSVFADMPTNSSIFIKEQKKDDYKIKVLSIFTIKKGDTCIKVTGYVLKECFRLAHENGRTPSIFITPSGKQIFDVPLYIGEKMAFVQYTKGENIYFGYILRK